MPTTRVLLAEPRGFCAGVEASLKSLAWMTVLHRPPVFCVRPVVHNEDVVARYARLGVRFVADPAAVPVGSPVLLSAHGSAPEDLARARRRAAVVVDAVCPLVTKVHHEIRSRARAGDTVLYIGHPGHDEAVGAIAQAPGRVVAVETPADVAAAPVGPGPVAVLAQTTLAYDTWRDAVAAAGRRFGEVWLPRRDDLCFATTNRQAAVLELARRCDAVVVVGSATSSNTRALAQTARRAGSPRVVRVAGPADLPADLVTGTTPGLAGDVVVGVTAGASTPARAVEDVVAALAPDHLDHLTVTRESEYFPLAPAVRHRLDRLADEGALPPPLDAAHAADRTTSADDLLGLVEEGGLVGALAGVGAAVEAAPGPEPPGRRAPTGGAARGPGPAHVGRSAAGRPTRRPVPWAS